MRDQQWGRWRGRGACVAGSGWCGAGVARRAGCSGALRALAKMRRLAKRCRLEGGFGRGAGPRRGRSGASEKAGAARLASACGREAAPGCSSGGHIAPSRAAAARGAVARTGVQPHFSDSRVPNGRFFSSSLHFARLRVCGTGYASRLEGAQNFFIIAISSRRFAIGMRKASAEAARARVCCG